MKTFITVLLMSTLYVVSTYAMEETSASAHSYFQQVGSNSLPDTTNKQELLEKIRKSENGFIRVIVRYDMKYNISDLKDNAQKQILRQNTENMHSQFRNQIGEQNVSGINESEYGPRVSLSVNEEGLKSLYNLHFIKSIREERNFFANLDQSTTTVQADVSWEGFGTTGYGETIVIIDTGVDYNHEMHSGKVVDGACFSTNDATKSTSSLCPNEEESQFGLEAGSDCGSTAGCDHGTHVAGIAAGNTSSLKGVAYEADIISIQVFSKYDDETFCAQQDEEAPCISIAEGDLLDGLEHTVVLSTQYDISAINMSLGGGKFTSTCDSDPLKDPIDNLYSSGVISVASSGNKNYEDAMNSPACISSVISVGATNNQDVHWSESSTVGSNAASFLELVAPGVSIHSSVSGSGNQYDSFTGTSMAAPHVAGTIALMREAYPNQFTTNYRTILQNTADEVSAMSPYSFTDEYGHGRLNTFEAVAQSLINNPSVYVFDYSHTYNSSEQFQDETIFILDGNSLTVNGDLSLTNTTLYIHGTLEGSGTIYLYGNSEIVERLDGEDNFQGSVEHYPNAYPITVRNYFNGYYGGQIGVGKNTSPTSKSSPDTVIVSNEEVLNLEAYDNQIWNGHTWVFNDTEGSTNKSQWFIEQHGDVNELNDSYNQSPSHEVDDDQGAVIYNVQKRIFTITRHDYSLEADNTFNTANVSVVEGNTLTAPSTQTDNGITYQFIEWSDGVTDNPRTIDSPTSSLTAHYKGSQLSDKTSAWKAPGSKIVRSRDGWQHMVYESMGHIWYEAKAPSGDWEIMPFHNRMHLDENGGTSPSISFNKSDPAFWQDMVAMVWQENSNIKLQTFYYSQSGGYYSPGPYQSISSGSRPNVAFTENEELIVIYRTSSGLAYTLYNFNYDEGGPLDEITSGTISGTSGASNVAVSSFTSGTHSWFDIVYEQSMDISGPPYFHGTEIRHTALRYIRDETSAIQIISPHVISSGSIVRNKEPSVISVSPTKKIVGWISATTDNSTWDPWETQATIAVLEWNIYGLNISRINNDHHVRSVSINKLDDNSEFYAAWSQIYDQSGWVDYNKFVAGSAWYTFKFLNTKGWDVQLAEADVANNMHAFSYYPKSQPYHWLQSNSLGSYQKQRSMAITQSRGIVLSDSAITTGFYFGIEDLMVEDVPVGFKKIARPSFVDQDFIKQDKFPIGRQTLQDVEPWLTSEPFHLKEEINLTFSESFSYGDSLKALGFLGKKESITFTATLVDDATGEAVGTLRELTIDGKQGFTRNNKTWKLKGNKFEGDRVRVEIAAETNLSGLHAVIEDGYSDDLALGKRAEKYFEDLEMGQQEEIAIYALGQNYPNPFNPTTQITYQLPEESMVRLEVFDLLGRRVQTLVNDHQTTGRHSVSFDASTLASGVYIYRLQAGDFTDSKSLFLIK